MSKDLNRRNILDEIENLRRLALIFFLRLLLLLTNEARISAYLLLTLPITRISSESILQYILKNVLNYIELVKNQSVVVATWTLLEPLLTNEMKSILYPSKPSSYAPSDCPIRFQKKLKLMSIDFFFLIAEIYENKKK